ncbi:MAG: GNAT family N-acetyltransferase [Actinomycetota bacterium]
MTVRVGTADDLVAVADIERDADRRFAEVELGDALDAVADPGSSEDLRAAADGGRLVVAEADQRAIGFAWWSELDGDAHLEQVSVIVDAAGQRIGRLLIDEVSDRAAADGYPGITLTTFADIAWNAPLYETYGFLPIDPTELGAGLAARRAHEAEIGLDVLPRVAMRRPFDTGIDPHTGTA